MGEKIQGLDTPEEDSGNPDLQPEDGDSREGSHVGEVYKHNEPALNIHLVSV